MNVIEKLIKEKKYSHALLELKLYTKGHKKEICLIMLYASCYYLIRDYKNALKYLIKLDESNESITNLPELLFYKAYCYYKLHNYGYALALLDKISKQMLIKPNLYQQETLRKANYLAACMEYYKNNITKCQSLLSLLHPNILKGEDKELEIDTFIIILKYAILGCIYFKKFKYQKAFECFKKAMKKLKKLQLSEHEDIGKLTNINLIDLLNNMSLCQYELGSFDLAKQLTKHILKQSFEWHPSWTINQDKSYNGSLIWGSSSRGNVNHDEVLSSGLVHACNLLACISLVEGNDDEAIKALHKIPYLNKSNVDAYTLHNESLIKFGSSSQAMNHLVLNYVTSFIPVPLVVSPGTPSIGIVTAQGCMDECIADLDKMLSPSSLPPDESSSDEGKDNLDHTIITEERTPPNAFFNLLVMTSICEKYDKLASLLATRVDLTYKQLDSVFYDYFDAMLTYQTSTTDGTIKMEDLSIKIYGLVIQDIIKMENYVGQEKNMHNDKKKMAQIHKELVQIIAKIQKTFI